MDGVPWVVLVVLVLLVVWTTLLNRTRLGRYIYAIGGNAEAARRAGINLSRIRVTAFALCGLTAGITGIIYASNLGSISNNFNGGQYVLYAVAAAVIGGTSLFGGRGRMLGAVLGGLVVGVIYNGLTLLGLGAAAQYIWTAAGAARGRRRGLAGPPGQHAHLSRLAVSPAVRAGRRSQRRDAADAAGAQAPPGGCAGVTRERRHDVLAQVQVEEGHRAARARHVVDVDAGLRHAAELEPVEQPGAGVPERAGAGVGGQERLGGRGVGGDHARRQPGRLLAGDLRGLGAGPRPGPPSRSPRAPRRAPIRGRARGHAAAATRRPRRPAAPPAPPAAARPRRPRGSAAG